MLFARSAYFEGAIVVEATLGAFRLTPDTLDRTPPEPGEGEPVPVQGGNFSSRAERDAGAGFPRGLDEQGAFGGGNEERRMGAPGGADPGGGLGGGPRQTLTVRIRSAAAEPVTVRVMEVRSALGGFVPVPERFTLAPGATQVLEPMHATHRAPIDELELLVTLRRKDVTEPTVLKLALPERRRP